MATTYQQPMVPSQASMNQFAPAMGMQPSVQNAPYWETRVTDSYRPLAASVNPAQRSYSGRSPRDYVAERLRDNPDGPPGVDVTEAKQLYRQAYQSLGGLDGLSSLELGHAAAYHAYCTLSEDPPLRNGTEYERETLIGLAVAEASRLMQQCGRDGSINACTAASEAAARTASRIFAQTHGAYDDDFRSRPLYSTNDYADSYEYGGGGFGDVQRPRPRVRPRGRSLSRTRRPTFPDTATVIPDANAGYNANRLIPGTTYSDVPPTGPRYPPTPYPTSDPGPLYPPTPYPASDPSLARYPSTPYPGSAHPPGAIIVSYPGTVTSNALPQVYQVPRGGASYHGRGANISAPSFSRGRSASFSYPQQMYMTQPAQAGYTNMPYTYPGVQPEQTIVIHHPKKHRHKHRHRHRSRSR